MTLKDCCAVRDKRTSSSCLDLNRRADPNSGTTASIWETDDVSTPMAYHTIFLKRKNSNICFFESHNNQYRNVEMDHFMFYGQERIHFKMFVFNIYYYDTYYCLWKSIECFDAFTISSLLSHGRDHFYLINSVNLWGPSLIKLICLLFSFFDASSKQTNYSANNYVQ